MRVIPYRCMTDMVEREEREVEEGEKVGGGLWLSEGSRPTCGSRFESLPPALTTESSLMSSSQEYFSQGMTSFSASSV